MPLLAEPAEELIQGWDSLLWGWLMPGLVRQPAVQQRHRQPEPSPQKERVSRPVRQQAL
jgi:hypothetical protein